MPIKRKSTAGHIALALLGSAILFAALQRPWWAYYLLHFYIPLAMLAGIGATILWKKAITSANEMRIQGLTTMTPNKEIVSGSIASIALTISISLWMGFVLPRLIHEMKLIADVPRILDSKIVRAMRGLQRDVTPCFSLERELTFHAGIPIEPELLVLSKKRFLSTGITKAEILSILKHKKLPLLLLRKLEHMSDSDWSIWVKHNYVLVEQDDDLELWIEKGRAVSALGAAEPRLGILGL